MKTTGTLLKRAREAKGISLQEVSGYLKINTRILKSLEEGDRSRLPAYTFLRGFVQSYGQFLKLDTGELLKTFYAEMGVNQVPVEIPTDSPTSPASNVLNITNATTPKIAEKKPTEQKSTSVQPLNPINPLTMKKPGLDLNDWPLGMKISAFATIIAVVLIVITIKKTVEKYEKEARVVPPPANLEAVHRNEVIAPIPSISPGAIDESLVTATTPIPTPTPSQTVAPIARHQEVIVEALDRVQITYSIDGGTPANLALAAEQIHTFKGKKKLELHFSDGGAINLTYNGKDIGVPGQLGQELRLSYPKKTTTPGNPD